jgi:hypothetical protein
MEDKFQNAEERERELLKQLFDEHLSGKVLRVRMTDVGVYDDFDVYVTGLTQSRWTSNSTLESKRYRYVIEAKIREQEYPEMIIEAKKLETIPSGHFLYYINFLKDKTLIWRLSKTDAQSLKRGKMRLPATTMGNSGLVWKDVYFLPMERAKLLAFGFNN